jgi:phosphatidate cytidylyltransferase
VSAVIIILTMGMLAAAIIAPAGRVLWVAAAIPYAGATGAAPIILRGDGEYGFAALILLFAVVWSTDSAAYFAGRAIGGPRLVPRFSPNKTWAGAVAGVAGAAIAAVAVAKAFGLGNPTAIMVLAIVLSVVSQSGDIFESALKRKFGAKDSSRLIPGHGGLMDRIDGFVAAAVVACAIGLVRGGIEAPAHGLLVW